MPQIHQPEDDTARSALVVEDDALVRTVLTDLLEAEGFAVTAADDGFAGFSAIEQHRFAVIICDVMMPFLGGKSLYEQIEQRFPTMASRVVFVTAAADQDETRQFLEQTGQPFFGKPFDPKRLVEAVWVIAGRPV